MNRRGLFLAAALLGASVPGDVVQASAPPPVPAYIPPEQRPRERKRPVGSKPPLDTNPDGRGAKRRRKREDRRRS